MEIVKTETKQITTTKISDLKKYADGAIVELPPFAKDMPLFAKLKRPSMMALMANGMIPNALLPIAEAMFLNGPNEADISTSDMYKVIKTMCEACMVEPTYQEIVDAGLELTDEQMLFIFNYSQIGVSALRSFRSE